MKKLTFLTLCLAGLLTACTNNNENDDVCSTNDDCGHGICKDGVCECTGLYELDNSGFCTLCLDGYVNNGTECIKNTMKCSTNADCGHGTCNFDAQGNKLCQCDAGFVVGTDNKCSACDTAAGYKPVGDTCAQDNLKPDDKCKNKDCGEHGTCSDGACTCQTGYKLGSDAKCSECAEGYKSNGTTCEADPGSCKTTFTYYNEYANADNNVSGVYLVGSFNDWKEEDPNYLMTTDGNGKWTIDVTWPVGTSHEYKYIVYDWAQDKWKTDAADGQSNGTASITQCGMKFGHGASTPTRPDVEAQLQQVEVTGKTITATFKEDVESVTGGVNPQKSGKTFTDTVSENGKYTYVVKAGGQEVYVPVWVEDEAFDWHDAILYFAFTDRFVNGKSENDRKSGTWENSSATDWYGGDFVGMKQKVEEGYFDNLGVNTLWISSVTKNTDATSAGTNGDEHNYSAYHSYWPVCAFRTAENAEDFGSLPAIEDHFGTIEELRALVDACHKRGIRVLVDFAANHVFKDSPIVEKHRDWFNDLDNPQLCDNNNNWDNYSEKCWFSQDLPDINYENADARKAMVDHAIWLIKETNIDGFRVDAVKHMNIQFIQDLRYAVDQLFKNTGITFYMVGETFTTDYDLLNKYIGDDLLHAQFDFPLYYQILNVLRGEGLYHTANYKTGYAGGFKSDLMGTFMGNHDVARAISVAAGHNEGKWGYNETSTDWTHYDRLMASWMILLTQPGVPLIYYGDEFGMPGSNDPDNRRMMLFGGDLNEQQQITLEFVQNVGKIRRAHKALSRGTRHVIGEFQNATVCYIMSYNDEDIIVGIGLPDKYGNNPGQCYFATTYNLVNLFTNDEVSKDHLDLSSEKFQLYRVKK